MSWNTQRHANTAQKAKALKEENNIISELCSKIDDEKNSHKLSITRQKELSDKLSSLQATSMKPKWTAKAHAAPTLEPTLRASLSGRVTSTSKVNGKTRAAADLYPVMGEWSFLCNIIMLNVISSSHAMSRACTDRHYVCSEHTTSGQGHWCTQRWVSKHSFYYASSAYLSLYRLNAQGGTASPYSFWAPDRQDFYGFAERSTFNTSLGANDFDNEFLSLERFLPVASTSSLATFNLQNISDNFFESYPPKVGEF